MIKTPKPLLIDLYQIVPYASITVCMYVILAPRYTSVYTPVCWYAGMPRHRYIHLKDKKFQSYKNISQTEHKNPISNKFYVKIKQIIMVWQFSYKCMAICISKLPIGTLPYYGNLPVGSLPIDQCSVV